MRDDCRKITVLGARNSSTGKDARRNFAGLHSRGSGRASVLVQDIIAIVRAGLQRHNNTSSGAE